MIRLVVDFFLPIIAFIINSTIFEHIKLHSVKPDLFIIIIVCMSVLRNDIEGALLGFMCGIMQDMFFGKSLGFFALLYMLTGYFCGKPFKYIYRENYFVPMILCFCATFFFDGCYFLLKFLRPAEIFYALSSIVFPQAVYNTVLILVFYPLMYFLNKKIENHEIRRRNFF
jgi:rod shape-determining protein MreD